MPTPTLKFAVGDTAFAVYNNEIRQCVVVDAVYVESTSTVTNTLELFADATVKFQATDDQAFDTAAHLGTALVAAAH